MAAVHLAASLSNEKLKISNPFSLYSLYNLTTLGFSARQGLHQDAQKSSKTVFPFKSDNFIISPLGFGKAMSGASCPGFNWVGAAAKG